MYHLVQLVTILGISHFWKNRVYVLRIRLFAQMQPSVTMSTTTLSRIVTKGGTFLSVLVYSGI
jgi:hypothetical protein